jgi:hypothetical protein
MIAGAQATGEPGGSGKSAGASGAAFGAVCGVSLWRQLRLWYEPVCNACRLDSEVGMALQHASELLKHSWCRTFKPSDDVSCMPAGHNRLVSACRCMLVCDQHHLDCLCSLTCSGSLLGTCVSLICAQRSLSFGLTRDSALAGTRHIGSLSTGLSALSQPFKLRLARGTGSDSALRDYSAQASPMSGEPTRLWADLGPDNPSVHLICEDMT